MRRNPPHQDHDLTRRRGLSLLEATVSTLLVGILMIAALQTLGASRRRESSSSDSIQGHRLVNTLMNEILLQSFEEPDSTQSRVFGPELGEATGNRSFFDDVDDYAGWASSPPADRDGTPLPGSTGWTCRIDVEWADPDSLHTTSTSFTGLKRIIVTATKNGMLKASLVSYRSIAWADTLPSQIDATGNRAPVAVAMSPYTSSYEGSVVTFDAANSHDPDDDYLSYIWDFGDGTTGVGRKVNKTFTTRGNYTVLLTVYDGRGGTATAARTITIYPR